MTIRWDRRASMLLLALVLVVATGAALLLRGGNRQTASAASVTFVAAERRDITVTVEATGTVEPINLVEVKSKASGQIIRMPVEVGSYVRPGDLLAQIDKVDVQNQFNQASAALEAARAQVEIARAEKARSDALFSQQIITAPEHESAVLQAANAESQLVRARTELESARIRLLDSTVRAPIAGTVLQKPVSVGQVISSATTSVSGGTTLLQMADLRRIRVRALVTESDIGNVRAGQPTTVVVDAFPDRQFRGEVEKIEPQAVVQQSVTMFPVLISLANEEGLLLPGMNGEVVISVESREDVLAIPVDAVRSVRDFASMAEALGLDPESARSRLRAGSRANADTMGTRGAGSDSLQARRRGTQGGQGRDGAGEARQGRRRGAAGDTTMARGARGGAGGTGGAGRAGSGQVVFVKVASAVEPRIVRLGASNFDYVEVLSGLKEGERVALLGVVELQAQRDQSMERIRQRVGGGVTGIGRGTGGAGGGRGGGGGGGGGGRGGG